MGAEMFSSLDGSMFILPVCYHPTTLLSVDDDSVFTDTLSFLVSDKLNVLCFNDPAVALEYIEKKLRYLPFTSRCLIEDDDNVKLNSSLIRDEMYNRDRFKAIFIIVTDYDMPHTSGIELIKTMRFSPEISKYAHIILTGKISEEFKAKLAELGKNDDYIGKDEPDYINKLINQVQTRSEKIFQWYSYVPARILSRNKNENTSFLFDGNFSPLFNQYIKEKNVCEFYLFDKQGSYIFLDDQANLSWLFVRNEKGIENTISLASQHGAPKHVIDALKSKEVILSLYENEDFENKKTINWDNYLLPASVFESDDHYLSFFPNLMPSNNVGKKTTNYYYAFTDKFPENNIKRENILSYAEFLNSQD